MKQDDNRPDMMDAIGLLFALLVIIGLVLTVIAVTKLCQ